MHAPLSLYALRRVCKREARVTMLHRTSTATMAMRSRMEYNGQKTQLQRAVKMGGCGAMHCFAWALSPPECLTRSKHGRVCIRLHRPALRSGWDAKEKLVQSHDHATQRCGARQKNWKGAGIALRTIRKDREGRISQQQQHHEANHHPRTALFGHFLTFVFQSACFNSYVQ
jgi:hypothetical protein